MLRFRRKAAALARVLPTAELLKLQKSGQFPEELVRIEVAQIHYVASQTY
jgi:hypothetical protein